MVLYTNAGIEKYVNLMPGSFFKFASLKNDSSTTNGEMGWSSLSQFHVYVGNDVLHTLIAICDYDITWLNKYGLFSAKLPIASRRSLLYIRSIHSV